MLIRPLLTENKNTNMENCRFRACASFYTLNGSYDKQVLTLSDTVLYPLRRFQHACAFSRWSHFFLPTIAFFSEIAHIYRTQVKSTQISRKFANLCRLDWSQINGRSPKKKKVWQETIAATGETHRCAGTASSNTARHSKVSKPA